MQLVQNSIMNMNRIFICVFGLTVFMSCNKDDEQIKSAKELICESKRYEFPLFTEVDITTVKYGSNINTSGVNQDLFMDVYTPKSDTLSKRPAIVLAFGGSFIAGDRKQLSSLATELAKLGYVAACIDYRLLSFLQWPIDSVKGFDIAIKASGDMKAAIRHLRKDAATTNLHKIDSDMIFAGGVSAGAITALQTAYFDASDNTEAHVKAAIDKNGGIEGNSGDAENLKYSSKVQGVINLSGAIYRPYFIDTGEPPVISFHGDADEVVPYGYDFVKPLGIPIIPLYGSSEVNKRANTVNVRTTLVTVKGGGHEDIYSDSKYTADFNGFKQLAFWFNKEIICE
jgi:para-nitrobenzyl esterase